MRIVEHAPRQAGGLRADFWNDWQRNEGVLMDAMTGWVPAGSTKGEEYMQGTSSAFVLRTGLAYRPRIEPARREAYPEIDGTRYRVVFVRGQSEEAKALRKGARPLRQWSPLWRRVTDEAVRWFSPW